MKNFYLDNSATTQTDSQVIKKLDNFLKNNYANPSSQHSLGKNARKEIENARKEIAKSINAQPEEIIFTSGGTESDNLALKGVAIYNQKQSKAKNHIITSNIEHPAILETCKQLENQGFKITYIKVNNQGIINPKDIEKAITEKTILVSIMHANNEIGTIQPIKQIGEICKKNNIPFHTDAVQSYTKIPINVKSQNISLLSVSGHKINALKGIGFLYIKKQLQSKIQSQITGGGQEKNIRSGTENTSGIISIAEALKIKRNLKQTQRTRNYIIKQLQKIPKAKINGSTKQNKRLCNNINISFYGIEGESLMLMLDKKSIQVSTGSACSSHKLQESHVLKAINKNIKEKELYTNGSIRISLDTRQPHQLTKKQADYLINSIKQSVIKLRQISPFKI